MRFLSGMADLPYSHRQSPIYPLLSRCYPCRPLISVSSSSHPSAFFHQPENTLNILAFYFSIFWL